MILCYGSLHGQGHLYSNIEHWIIIIRKTTIIIKFNNKNIFANKKRDGALEGNLDI